MLRTKSRVIYWLKLAKLINKAMIIIRGGGSNLTTCTWCAFFSKRNNCLSIEAKKHNSALPKTSTVTSNVAIGGVNVPTSPWNEDGMI